MIPPIYRINNKSIMIKNSIHNYIYWSKFNFLPTTLSRTKRHTSPIL
uniref:Uncharacterized protein n=1 Tax=Rhodnius prolixus TaxID=13249 RepID=T1HPT7_RHOPR